MTRPKPTAAVTLDRQSWDVGYQAGYAGQPHDPPPPGVLDRLAFYSGWIEGDATRAMTARAMAPVRCFQCGSDMEETGRNEIAGWRQWDCPVCGSTVERRPARR